MRTGLLIAAALVLATRAFAHDGHVSRRLLMQPLTGGQMQVVFHLEVTGHRRASWLAMADRDRDGRLSKRERAALRAMLVDQALDGIALTFVGRRPPLEDLQTKLDATARRPLAVMALARVSVPADADAVTVRSQESTRPLAVIGLDVAGKTGFSRQLEPGETAVWSYRP